MKVSRSRLAKMLATERFVPRSGSSFAHSFGFVRDDVHPGLYQEIRVAFAGRKQEAVFAYIDVSAVKWTAAKGLSESRILCEVSNDPDPGRCRAFIYSKDEAIAWEQLLLDVAPPKAAEFAADRCGILLERTELARAIAKDSLSRLTPSAGVAVETERLRNMLAAEKVSDADRLSSRAGVIQVRGADHVYDLASLAVLAADANNVYIGQDPLFNSELMWEIQLVADGILSWDENALIRQGRGGRPR